MPDSVADCCVDFCALDLSPRTLHQKFSASVAPFGKTGGAQVGTKHAMGQCKVRYWYAPCKLNQGWLPMSVLFRNKGEVALIEAPKEASLQPDMQAGKELAQSKPKRQEEGLTSKRERERWGHRTHRNLRWQKIQIKY